MANFNGSFRYFLIELLCCIFKTSLSCHCVCLNQEEKTFVCLHCNILADLIRFQRQLFDCLQTSEG